jgi:hypothetical protein
MAVAMGHNLPALPGLNWATITRVFWRAVREPALRRVRKFAIPRCAGSTTPWPPAEPGGELANAEISRYQILPVGFLKEKVDMISLLIANSQGSPSALAANVLGYSMEGSVRVESRTSPGWQMLAVGCWPPQEVAGERYPLPTNPHFSPPWNIFGNHAEGRGFTGCGKRLPSVILIMPSRKRAIGDVKNPCRGSVFGALEGHKLVAGGNAPGKRRAYSPTLKGSHYGRLRDAGPE